MKEDDKKPRIYKQEGGNFAPLPFECSYTLTPEESCEISRLAESLPTPTLREVDDDHFMGDVLVTSDELPRPLRERLSRFRYNSNIYGTLLIRGLQDDEPPLTPDAGEPDWDEPLPLGDKAMLLVMSRLGDLRAYIDEKFGAPRQSVYPLRNTEYRQENSGSLSDLLGHTEDGFLLDKCDFLGLFCRRADHEGVALTGTASATRALRLISWQVIEWLSKPLYVVGVPTSFVPEGGGKLLWSPPMPVLTGDLRTPQMTIDLDAMRGLTREAEVALQVFARALMSVMVYCALAPGDLLAIDNLTAIHARTHFRPRYDGRDRWLSRVKVALNPRASAVSRPRGSRVCDPVILEIEGGTVSTAS
jgi:L-asparagine oxygenase